MDIHGRVCPYWWWNWCKSLSAKVAEDPIILCNLNQKLVLKKALDYITTKWLKYHGWGPSLSFQHPAHPSIWVSFPGPQQGPLECNSLNSPSPVTSIKDWVLSKCLGMWSVEGESMSSCRAAMFIPFPAVGSAQLSHLLHGSGPSQWWHSLHPDPKPAPRRALSTVRKRALCW